MDVYLLERQNLPTYAVLAQDVESATMAFEIESLNPKPTKSPRIFDSVEDGKILNIENNGVEISFKKTEKIYYVSGERRELT